MNKYHGWPEKWCIIRNKKTYIDVNKWFNQIAKPQGIKFSANGEYFDGITEYLHHPMNGNRYVSDRIGEGYTLITYEDFLQNVVWAQQEELNYQIY